MTFRSVILGFIGAAFIAGVGYMNWHIQTSSLTRGHFPISVFGLLIILVAFLNPLLFKIRRKSRFAPGEFAVIIAMMLVACSIPSAGLMRYFSANIVMPVHYNRSDRGWDDNKVLSYVPKSMLVNDGQYDERSVGGYMGGIGKPGDPINVRDVPWDKWSGPLCTWIPLVLLCAVAVICMSLIIHPQWSKRERLRYPIADFANSLLQQDRDRATGPIFRNKVFWIALVAVLAIRLMNGAHTWYPHTMIEVKLKFIFTGAFKDKFPLFMNYQYANLLTEPEIIPAVIAFSFFLASDISFSIGISHFVSCVAIYLFMRAGVDIAGTYMEGGIKEWCNFGSCLGVAALIVYVGRRYYLQLFKRAMFLGKSREIERYAVWACRIFIVAVAGMIAWLVYFGLDWPLAVMAVLMVLLLFLIVARVNAECGLFFYKPPWMIPGILVGLIGMQTLGPQMLAIVAMFAIMLTADTFECLIPYVTNGLKINETVGVRPGKTGWMAAGAFALGLAVVIPVALWADYNFGIGNHGWVKWASKQTFDTVTRTVKTLTTAGSLDQVLDYTWWERIRNIRPDLTCLYAIGVGFLLVVIVGKLRLRFPWWFVHPVIFLGFGARIIGKFGFSFLLGCLIKVVLTRVGGQQKYRQARPLMVGVIAGDLFGGLIFMVINWVYYLVNGIPGEEYKVW